MGAKAERGKTELLEILKRCRKGGLNFEPHQVLAVYYSGDSLIMVFRFEDGLTYRLELKQIETQGELNEEVKTK